MGVFPFSSASQIEARQTRQSFVRAASRAVQPDAPRLAMRSGLWSTSVFSSVIASSFSSFPIFGILTQAWQLPLQFSFENCSWPRNVGSPLIPAEAPQTRWVSDSSVFWVVTQRKVVGQWHFRNTCPFHLQGWSSFQPGRKPKITHDGWWFVPNAPLFVALQRLSWKTALSRKY
jgi:hypothetical protein